MAVKLDGMGMSGARLTATGGPGVVVVAINSGASRIVSVKAISTPGLTFSLRGATGNVGGTYNFTYTAPYTSNFSDTIVVTPSSMAYTSVLAFAVRNASAFDPNASLPAINGDSQFSAKFSTTNANAFLFACGTPNDTGTDTSPPDGWTLINSGFYLAAMYKIVSEVQSDEQLSFSQDYAGSIIDAFNQ